MATNPFSYTGMMKANAGGNGIGNGFSAIARYRQAQLQKQQAANSIPTPAEQDWATQQLSNANGATGANVAAANSAPGAMSSFEGEGPQDSGGGDLGMDSFAQGQVVTRPTIALLGEKGAEVIQPLNNNPNNKVNAPAVLSRYRGRV